MLPSLPLLAPANEEARLQALQPYLPLRNVPDALFDILMRLVARVFNTSIVLLTLVDADTTWFKANYGVPQPQHIPRLASVSGLTISHGDTIVVEDVAAASEEICKLTSWWYLQFRFYATHPLQTPAGYSIGALCIMDRPPRLFGVAEQQRLRALARITSQLLTLRTQLQQHVPADFSQWAHLFGTINSASEKIDAWRTEAHLPANLFGPPNDSCQQAINQEVDEMLPKLYQKVGSLRE